MSPKRRSSSLVSEDFLCSRLLFITPPFTQEMWSLGTEIKLTCNWKSFDQNAWDLNVCRTGLSGWAGSIASLWLGFSRLPGVQSKTKRRSLATQTARFSGDRSRWEVFVRWPTPAEKPSFDTSFWMCTVPFYAPAFSGISGDRDQRNNGFLTLPSSPHILQPPASCIAVRR